MVTGAVAAAVAEPFVARRAPGRARYRAVSAVLLLAWLADRWAPFVPSIDFQNIKDSLKPVLLDPVFDVGGIVGHTAAWLAVACLLRHFDRDGDRSAWLAALAAAVFVGQIVIVHNVLGVPAVAGAAIAIAIWWIGLRRAARPERIVALAFPVALAIGALTPLRLATETTPFVWLPFGGFLDGSMWVNAHSALHKTFLYGVLVYLPRLAGWPFRIASAAAVVLVTAIEVLQTLIVGHSPEITDPILVVAAAFAIVSVEAAARRPT
jgi:hypothetical protein